MQNIANQNLQYVAVQNQTVPGTMVEIPLVLDFTTTDTLILDLSQMIRRGFIDMVQTLYANLANFPAPLSVTAGSSGGFSATMKPATCGWYSIFAPNPCTLTFSATQGSGVITVFLSNVPMPGVVWPTA